MNTHVRAIALVASSLSICLSGEASAQHVFDLVDMHRRDPKPRIQYDTVSSACNQSVKTRKDVPAGVQPKIAVVPPKDTTFSWTIVCAGGLDLRKNSEDNGRLRAKLRPLTFSADLVTRAEDLKAGNYVAPAANADYSGIIRRGDHLRFDGSVHLNLQGPITQQDTTEALTRLLASGGVGKMEGSFRASTVTQELDAGVSLGVSTALSWQNNTGLTAAQSIPTFAYQAHGALLSIWGGPAYVGVQRSWNKLIGLPVGFVQQSLDGSSATNVLIALRMSDSNYLQVKMLMPQKNQQFKSQNLEIRFVTAFTPF